MRHVTSMSKGLPLLLAAAVFAQSPRPSQLIMGRRATAATRDVKLTPKAPVLASTAYAISINGTEFSFTSDATAQTPPPGLLGDPP